MAAMATTGLPKGRWRLGTWSAVILSAVVAAPLIGCHGHGPRAAVDAGNPDTAPADAAPISAPDAAADAAKTVVIPEWTQGMGVQTLANFRASYTIQDLGFLPGGDDSYAVGINDSGTIVGRSNTTPGSPCFTIFRYVPGGPIVPLPMQGEGCGIGAVINNGGTIAFSPKDAAGKLAVWRLKMGGQVEILGVPAGVTDPAPYPTAMNSAGLMAITDWFGSTIRAFAYRDGFGFVRLPTPAGAMSFTHGLGDDGEILGGIALMPNNLRAVRWTGPLDALVVEDLNTWLPPGTDWILERAKASNGRFIVGSGTQAGRPRGFVIDKQTRELRDLQATVPAGDGVFPAAVNRHNMVVGSLRSGVERGFVAAGDRAELIDDLLPPGSGWAIVAASGLNDAGQIVGRGLKGGVGHAFLLAPTQPVP